MGGFIMSKPVALFVELALIFTLSACHSNKADVKRADEFLTALSSFESADHITDIDELVDLSASIIGLPVKAFDTKDGWERKKDENEKYIVLFNADTTLSIYFSSGKINRVTYTFRAASAQDTHDSIDNLVSIYGEPTSVSLNGKDSSYSETSRAANNSDNPDFKYYYEWITELHGQNISVYEAYYDDSGINFTYIVVSKYKEIGIINKWWS